ncbi:MAG: phosphodiesterase [Sinobacteraceae bacterium]|nr:phosphodiesterase [Nevskiaceae bacterium]
MRVMAAVRFLQITDTHLTGDPQGGIRGVATLASLHRVLRHAAAEISAADALLLTGDLVHDDAAGYGHLQQSLGSLDKAVLAIAGNHDDPQQLAIVLSAAPFRVGGTHTFGDWCVILLDTHQPGAVEGHLSDDELGRLEAALEAQPRHVLVVMHHPPVPMGSRWLDAIGLINAESFWRIIDRHDCVRGVLWGHAHQAFDASRGSIKLMATPSSCVQFAVGTEQFALDDKPPGYRSVVLHPNGRIDTCVRWVA